MMCAHRVQTILLAAVCVALTAISVEAQTEKKLEKFDPKNFSHPTVINNEWYPLKPGTKFVWSGYAVDEEGDEEAHSTSCIVTDLVKEIAGVKTVVCLERDFVDKELEEAEVMFLAQDNKGDVWLLGEYPEEYSDGKFEKQTGWIHGCKDGHAGIIMKKDFKLNTDWSEGWAPSVEYTDHAFVYKVGQKVTVPVGSFNDVVIIDESNQETIGAHHLKYYCRGTGVVHIDWRGKKTDQEKMDLVTFEKHISADEMAKAREGALKLDKHGYEVSKDVYALTKRIDSPNEPAASK